MPPNDFQDHLDQSELARENEKLRADLALERRRAAENEARADNLDAQVSQNSARLHSAQLAQLMAQEQSADDAIKAAASQLEGLEAQLAELNAQGKFPEAAKVQVAIGKAAAAEQQAIQAKSYFAQQRTNYSAAPADPVERFIADNPSTYSAEDMEWIRRNRRFATDPAFRNRVIQAHGEALQRGIPQRSEEYYRHIEHTAYMRPVQSEPPADQQPYSNGQEDEEPREPEIRIVREPDMNRSDYRSSPVDADGNPLAFERRPDNPQTRAAGSGSLRSAIAGAPSRRSPVSNGRRTILELTEGERDSALAMAPHLMGADVLQGGQARILQEYNDWKNSAAAERIRQGWLERR